MKLVGENQEIIWANLIENELLYERNDYMKNKFIGETYVEVCKNANTKLFNETYREIFPDATKDDVQNSDIVKFIRSSGVTTPIHKQDFTYIVMPNGETLSCLNNPNKNN